MSNSRFAENSTLPMNNNESLQETCRNNNNDSITEPKSLVVICGKNGISVDRKGLEDLMDDRIASTISVIRLHSPTSSNSKDDNKKSKKGNNINNNGSTSNVESDEKLSATNENSTENNTENDSRKVLGVTIEAFYHPDEAKQIAKEILNHAGISSPLEIQTDLLEFRRFIIQNDHCYTPLVSPSQVKSATASPTHSTSSVQNSELLSRSQSNRSLNRGSTVAQKKNTTNSSDKQSTVPVGTIETPSKSGVETNQSEGEEEEEYSEYSETSSGESDNDRDSDLDYDVNDRGRRRRKVSAKKKTKAGKKVTNRRRTLNVEREDDEKKIPYLNRLNRQSVDSRKSLSATNTIISSLPNTPLTPKVPLKVYSASKNQQAKGIHIISQHKSPETEMQKETPSILDQQLKSIPASATVDSSRSLLRVLNTASNVPPKRKSEGVFTEISTFLKQGESSKPNIKVTQLRPLESPSKGFMPLGVEAAAKNQLPAQISIQTHQSSSELAAENDKQLDLIDSIVKDEMKKKSPIVVKETMNENIPHLVKMLESTEKAILAKSKSLALSSSSNVSSTIASTSSSSTFANSVEDIDITNAPLLETAEDEIPEDLLQHVAELMENKNIQEVIDKEVLSSQQMTSVISETQSTSSTTIAESIQQQQKLDSPLDSLDQTSMNSTNGEMKSMVKKEPIEIVRKDGRVIKLPPIEAPTTRAKRRAQTQGTTQSTASPISLLKQQTNMGKAQTSNSRRNSAAHEQKATTAKKRGSASSSAQSTPKDNVDEAETDSEDDPNKLWCICRQPHNNRFMICCDACEDWFHGTCVNITKAMGIEMELKGVEWRCPNCMKKEDPETKKAIQSKINEFMIAKKAEANATQQQKSDDGKKSNDNKKVQSQVGGTKKVEQIKKVETNRQKSITVDQKKGNDNVKSPATISESSQKKITEMFKRTESPTRNKSLISIESNSFNASSTNAENNISTPKVSEQIKHIVIEKKIPADSNRSPKDMQKKTHQLQQDNNLDNVNNVSGDGSSRTIKSKVIEKSEKQVSKNENPKVTATTKDPTLLNCVVCKKPVRPNSIYCSDDCIRKHANDSRIIVTKASKAAAAAASSTVEDDKKKKIPSSFEEALAKASETTLQTKKIERVFVFERKSGRILTGSSAPTVANLKKWLKDNPTFEVVQPGSPQFLAIEKSRQRQKLLPVSGTSTTSEKSLIKVSVGNSTTPTTPTTPNTPTTFSPIPKGRTILQIDAQPLSSTTPKLKKIQITTISKSAVTKDLNKSDSLDSKKVKEKEDIKETTKENAKDKKEESKEKEKETKQGKSIKKQSSVDQSKETQNTSSNESEPIRLMVKKTLKEQLMNRMNEIKDSDAPRLTENEIEEFVNETEVEMYKLFNSDTGTKYKTKYRSLMFNIKDRKNETLFEKICSRIIEPKQLVRMSPEEMASQELAQWRQNENKHQLEMIKKSELDLLSCKKNYVLKTHKGEEVIEGKSTDQVSLDITIPVEDVVTVLNSSTVVSSTTNEIVEDGEQMSPTMYDKGKDTSNNKVSSSHEVSLYDTTANISNNSTMMTSQQEIETKEKHQSSTSVEKRKVHSSNTSSSGRDKDKNRDRHHRSKEKHKHRKRSRSRDRSRDHKHRSPGREEKRSRSEKEKERDRSSDGSKKERYEIKEKSDVKEKPKDKHHEISKDKPTTSLVVEKHHHDSKSKQSTKLLLSNSGNSNSSTSQSGIKTIDKDSKSLSKMAGGNKSFSDYNLIDKILESTKTVEEAANLIGSGDESVKEKEKDKRKEKEKEKDKDKEKNVDKEKEKDKEKDKKKDKDKDKPLATTVTTTTTTTTNMTSAIVAKTSSPLYSSTSTTKLKSSESNVSSTQDSDQEPSSTVTIATPPEDPYVKYSNDIASIIWSGSINMIDVATFQIIIQPISGIFNELDKDLPGELDVVGRISPDTVWEYIVKIKKSPNKEIVIVRLVPSTETENLAYIALYTYLDKRKRLGVVKTTSSHLKDFYILPLGARKMLPQVLQSSMNKNTNFYDDDLRPDLLMGIIIRIMGKRVGTPLQTASTAGRGFHPPTKIRKTDTSVISSHISNLIEEDENYTPPSSPKRKLLSSSSTKSILTAGRLPPPQVATDAIDLDTMMPSAVKLAKSFTQDDEPYSPGGSSDDDNIGIMPLSSTNNITDAIPDDLKREMDELNRQIEARKMEIAGMLNMDQNKSFSTIPSVDLTPALANISIPSNLQQILESIKQTTSSSSAPSSSLLSTSVSSIIDPKISTTTTKATTLASSSSLSHILPSSSSSSSSSTLSSISSNRIPAIVPQASSSTFSNTAPQLIGSLLNNDEEYIPGPVTSKIHLSDIKEHSLGEKSTDLAATASTASTTETFTHDVDLRVEYPQLAKKSRWDMIHNPPPPGLEDEYS